MLPGFEGSGGISSTESAQGQAPAAGRRCNLTVVAARIPGQPILISPQGPHKSPKPLPWPQKGQHASGQAARSTRRHVVGAAPAAGRSAGSGALSSNPAIVRLISASAAHPPSCKQQPWQWHPAPLQRSPAAAPLPASTPRSAWSPRSSPACLRRGCSPTGAGARPGWQQQTRRPSRSAGAAQVACLLRDQRDLHCSRRPASQGATLHPAIPQPDPIARPYTCSMAAQTKKSNIGLIGLAVMGQVRQAPHRAAAAPM